MGKVKLLQQILRETKSYRGGPGWGKQLRHENTPGLNPVRIYFDYNKVPFVTNTISFLALIYEDFHSSRNFGSSDPSKTSIWKAR